MDIKQFEADAKAFLAAQGLADWKIAYNRRRAFGLCNWVKKTIFFNDHYARNADREHVWGTFLHEVAHALTEGHGHDAVWKAMAEKLGASPERTCGDAHLLPNSQWEAKCPACMQLYRRSKRPVGRFICAKPTCDKVRLVFKTKESVPC